MVYDRMRRDELRSERAKLRAEALEAAQRKLDLLDLELAGLLQIQARELAVELGERGFDVTGFKPLPLPDTRRERPQRHGPNVDPWTLARQEEAAGRGVLHQTVRQRASQGPMTVNKPRLYFLASRRHCRPEISPPDVVMADV